MEDAELEEIAEADKFRWRNVARFMTVHGAKSRSEARDLIAKARRLNVRTFVTVIERKSERDTK